MRRVWAAARNGAFWHESAITGDWPNSPSRDDDAEKEALTNIVGMYGPPQSCKRKTEIDKLVCANVFGLWWSQRLLAMMDSARSLPY
jgi:hypothetical protein